MAMYRKVSLVAAFLLFFTQLPDASAEKLDLSEGTLSFSGTASVRTDVVTSDNDEADISSEEGTLILLPEVGYFLEGDIQAVVGLDVSANIYSSVGFGISNLSAYVGFAQYFQAGTSRPYIGAGAIAGARILSSDFSSSNDVQTFGFVGPYATVGLLMPINANVAVDVGLRATVRYFPDLDLTTIVIPFGALGLKAFF